MLYHKKIILYFIIILLFIPFLFIYSQSYTELQNKITETNEEIEKLEKEVKKYQNELVVLSGKKNTLEKEIKELDLTKKKLEADIKLTQNKIIKTNLKIESLSFDIEDKNLSIDKNKEALVSSIKQVNELDNNSLAINLLKKESLGEVWKDIDDLFLLKKSIIEKIENLKIVKGDLEENKRLTEEIKKEAEDLKKKLSDQKKLIEENTRNKNNLLKQTKNSEANYQKLVKEQNLKIQNLEKELRDYESQLKYILDPDSLPGKNSLSWPVDSVYITQLFGKTASSGRLYASGSHSGVDFRASVGTPIKSMSDGTVLGFGDTDLTCPKASFGKWILIEHNNGLSTTYGHLSLISVKKGQKVKNGQIIGYSGNTGRTTGPHLHITVYSSKGVKIETLPSKSCVGKTLTQPFAAINAYLDPMRFLPNY